MLGLRVCRRMYGVSHDEREKVGREGLGRGGERKRG